ncbi:HAD family hydrolase [bacterium]|nr:HAD family hydrolase [bacterium]
MFGPVKNVIFDLDGTLIDSMPGAVAGLKGILKKVLGAPVSDEEFTKALGKSPREIFACFLEEASLDEAVEDWNHLNLNTTSDQVPMFKGVSELVSFLVESNAHNLALYTGRDRKGAERFISLHEPLRRGLSPDLIRCGDDGFKPKPSGEAVKDILSKFAWSPEDTIFVGDHHHDCGSAREAGVKFGAALWDEFLSQGNTSRAKFKGNWERWDAHNVDLRFNTPITFLNWLKNDQG